MDRSDGDTSYPDPNIPHSGAGPFYSNQPQMPGNAAQQTPHAPPHAPMANMQSDHSKGREPTQNQPFLPDYSHGQPSTPQQLAQQGLEMNRFQGTPDTGAKDKKIKTSRACDECRRKKIKCDAESEQPDLRCSSCRRSDNQCQFSRAPQKRGPSKGYIKELAQRVDILENRSGANPPAGHYSSMTPGMIPPTEANPYSPQPGYNQRKRTYSMSEAPQGYVPIHEQLQEYARAPANKAVPGHAGGDGRQNSAERAGISSETLEGYYQQVHSHIPILPDSPALVQLHLDRASPGIREAFVAALGAAVISVTSSDSEGGMRVSSEILAAQQKDEPTARAQHDNLVYLQTLVFMIIATEHSGPIRNQNTTWLAIAMSVASHLRLYLNKEPEPVDGGDVYSSSKAERRAWLVLVMLDRWHAASMASPLLVMDESIHLLPSDRALLGNTAYELVRASLVLGHLSHSYLFYRQDFAASGQHGLSLNRVMRGEIDRYRESVEERFFSTPHLHLAYLHVKLLADRSLGVFASSDEQIINGAINLVRTLTLCQTFPAPLAHHYAALAATTLVAAPQRDKSISKILLELRSFLESSHLRRQVPNTARPVWHVAILNFMNTKLDRGGLQHLADAATGVDGRRVGDDVPKSSEGDAIDWTAMISSGYLNDFE